MKQVDISVIERRQLKDVKVKMRGRTLRNDVYLKGPLKLKAVKHIEPNATAMCKEEKWHASVTMIVCSSQRILFFKYIQFNVGLY
jgi:hypothetical protein